MGLYEVDPLQDHRWVELLGRHDSSSLFHTPQWLSALQQTYGYEPIAFTDAPPGHPIENALLFCRVSSWMTGRRLISLPFSDHCEPLVKNEERLAVLLEALKTRLGAEG